MFLTGYGERNADQHKKLLSSLLRTWIVIYNIHENTTVLTTCDRICDKRLFILLKNLWLCHRLTDAKSSLCTRFNAWSFALWMSEKHSKVKRTLDRIRWNRFMTWIEMLLLITQTPSEPIPVAARSKAWVCSRSLTGIVVSNPAGGMDDCYELCVLSRRGLCVGLITRPEESYRVWCVWVWSWILDNEEALTH